jgi:hypothetical protein
MTKNVLILCISMLCFSCNSTVEQSEQLMEYLINAENNLYWEAVNNDILFAAYIRPSSLLAEQEARAFSSVTPNTLDSIFSLYNQNLYIMLELSKNNKAILQQVASPADYTELVSVLSFRMHDYVYLVTSKNDTITPIDYQFGQYYGMEISNSLLFSFPAEPLLKQRKFDLIIDDFGIGTTPVRFTFRTKDIKRIPHLNPYKEDES